MVIQSTRSIEKIVTAVRVVEGGGFPVRRPIPNTEMEQMENKYRKLNGLGFHVGIKLQNL